MNTFCSPCENFLHLWRQYLCTESEFEDIAQERELIQYDATDLYSHGAGVPRPAFLYVHSSSGHGFLQSARSQSCDLCSWLLAKSFGLDGRLADGLDLNEELTFMIELSSPFVVTLTQCGQRKGSGKAYGAFGLARIRAAANTSPSGERITYLNDTPPDHAPVTEMSLLDFWNQALPTITPCRISLRKATVDAKTMLETCRSTHEKCQHSAKPTSMPKRLLDINSFDPASIRLVETHGMTEAPYAILSYCWGSEGDHYKLTETRLNSYMSGWPLNDLPDTIKDAVCLTRAMEIRYIWIDALCIVQDQVADWDIEALKMGQYYSEAELCISALGATSVDNGLFDLEDAHDGDFIAPNFTDYVLSLRPTVSNERDYSRSRPALKESLLSSRGWTLQERLLSRRLLHISTGIHLECCQGTTSWEKSYSGELRLRLYGPSIGSDMDVAKFSKFLKLTRLSPLELVSESLLRAWQELVMAYAPRNLKYQKDRFIALDGLRQQFQERLRDKYFYGVWQTSVYRHLLWYDGSKGFDPVASCIYDPVMTTLFDSNPFKVVQEDDTQSGQMSMEGSIIYGQRTELPPESDASLTTTSSSTLSTADMAPNMSTFEAFPTWSWASHNGKISFFDVKADALLQVSIMQPGMTSPTPVLLVMKRAFVKATGELRTDVACKLVRPFIALSGRVAEVEIEDGVYIRTFKYRAQLKGFPEHEPLRGQSRVFMDNEDHSSLVKVHAFIMYNSGHQQPRGPTFSSDLSSSMSPEGHAVLTMLLLKEVQLPENVCQTQGVDSNSAFERVGLAIFRHEQSADCLFGELGMEGLETVYVV